MPITIRMVVAVDVQRVDDEGRESTPLRGDAEQVAAWAAEHMELPTRHVPRFLEPFSMEVAEVSIVQPDGSFRSVLRASDGESR
jgi:hypothetical protein